MNLLEAAKRHWFGSLLVIGAALVGTTWKVIDELYIGPRDFEIAQLKDQIAQQKAPQDLHAPTHSTSLFTGISDSVVLPMTGIFENASATTSDGKCTIAVVKVENYGRDVTLRIIVGTGISQLFEDKHPGDRVTVSDTENSYYVDIHRIRENIVDISVSKHQLSDTK